MANWEFASTGGGFEEGINNTLTEHFEGNYNYYLAREIIQNSLDARDSQNKPVKVVFELSQYNTLEFPERERFVQILGLCKKTHPGDKKNQEFFNNAEQLMAKEKIPVLKISDFNTVGLHGSDNERDSPWYALVKSRGVSQKTEGAGGSFGLGKGAVFAASHLRTAFYSSTSMKDAMSRFLGVSMLVNFDEEGDTKQSIGSFGGKKQSTIFKALEMGDFWRKEKGLDIYIMGYKVENKWDDELLKSVLRNFWYAILCEDLIVEVGNKIVNFDNLEKLLTDYFFEEPFKDHEEPKGNPLSYYQAVINGKDFKQNLPSLGNVRFHFYPLEEPLNYVAMIRKTHMVIYSRSFIHAAPYSGVFICDNEEGNELLRKMEPPAHDKWDPDRSKPDGLLIMNELINWVKLCLKEVKKQRSEQISEIPGLAKYLPLDEGQSEKDKEKGSTGKGNAETDETKREEGAAEIFEGNTIIEPFKVSIINRENTGMGGKDKILRSGKRRLKSKVSAPGGGKGKQRALTTEEFHIKLFSTSKDFTFQEYTAIIKGNYNGRCNIKIIALGDEGSDKIKINEILDPRGYKYKLNNNCVMGFYMNDGEQVKLKLILEDKLKVALKAEAYEIRQ